MVTIYIFLCLLTKIKPKEFLFCYQSIFCHFFSKENSSAKKEKKTSERKCKRKCKATVCKCIVCYPTLKDMLPFFVSPQFFSTFLFGLRNFRSFSFFIFFWSFDKFFSRLQLFLFLFCCMFYVILHHSLFLCWKIKFWLFSIIILKKSAFQVDFFFVFSYKSQVVFCLCECVCVCVFHKYHHQILNMTWVLRRFCCKKQWRQNCIMDQRLIPTIKFLFRIFITLDITNF